MKKLIVDISPVVLMLVLFTVAAPVSAANVSCGDTLTIDTELDSNLSCSGTALIIGANGITLDLGGHTLMGNGTSIGIDNTGGYDNVTIKDGVIDSFANGILLSGASGNTLTELEARNSVNTTGVEGVGILLWLDNDSNAITENYIHDNDRQGIYLGCNPFAFSGSVSDCDGRHADNNLITENEIFNNGQAGFDAYGIQLQFADQNIVSENDISGHLGPFWFAPGIYVLSSSNNIIEENNVTDNWYGTVLWDCGFAGTADGNTFCENKFEDNGLDIWHINGMNTTWDENECDTSSPDGLCGEDEEDDD